MESEQVAKTMDNAVQTFGHKGRTIAGMDMGQRKGLKKDRRSEHVAVWIRREGA